MLDYVGSMDTYQKRLDMAGINYDITLLAGATQSEVEGFVNGLIYARKEVDGVATSQNTLETPA